MTETVAFSFASSPDRDLAQAGVSLNHLRHASLDVALHLLRNGFRLAYGGDLRADGFTRALMELVRAYADDAPALLPLVNYFAFSTHRTTPEDELRAAEEELSGAGVLHYLDPEGNRRALEEFAGEGLQDDPETWGRTLSAMRRVMAEECTARIAVGGKIEGYKGFWPGIAEESWLTIEAGKPLYVVGGFGGCARSVARAFGLLDDHDVEPSFASEDARRRMTEALERISSLRDRWTNGLTRAQNATLARTRTAGTIFALVTEGLRAVRRGT